jgi:(E)-4-hydroxy-3-methylbut-2-enyl-diphosphate synthase
MAPDLIYLENTDPQFKLPGTLKKIFDYDFWKNLSPPDAAESFPLFDGNNYLNAERLSDKTNFVKLSSDELTDDMLNALSGDSHAVLVLNTDKQNAVADFRSVFVKLIDRGILVPVIVYRKYDNLTEEQLMLYSSTDIGSLLIDGFGDGIWIDYTGRSRRFLACVNNISFTILQAARTRISRTEYIACPSCGRTQFDLQETTSMIRAKTSHLKGLKIAVMGCIVNGPGEMADADYGFVGSGPGWVTLYRGKEVIERGIPYEKALGKLIELVKEDGNWLNPN